MIHECHQKAPSFKSLYFISFILNKTKCLLAVWRGRGKKQQNHNIIVEHTGDNSSATARGAKLIHCRVSTDLFLKLSRQNCFCLSLSKL